jgi:hypothetical protein
LPAQPARLAEASAVVSASPSIRVLVLAVIVVPLLRDSKNRSKWSVAQHLRG